ncbi:MAG: hypothetical protein ABGY42_15540, partial [bacterium]
MLLSPPLLLLSALLSTPAVASEIICESIPATRLKITATDDDGRDKIVWKSRLSSDSLPVADPAMVDVRI